MTSAAVEAERLRLYAYATAQEASSYIAIMHLFVGALLAEWLAQDLVGRGIDLPLAAIDQRPLPRGEPAPVALAPSLRKCSGD